MLSLVKLSRLRRRYVSDKHLHNMSSTDFDFHNVPVANEFGMKRIVIVGASSGIGLALAEAFASRNIPVGLAARRTKPLEDLKKRYPSRVAYAEIDINKPEAVSRLNRLITDLGGMDIYIHSAGIGFENLTMEPESEAHTIETNTVGFARMISSAYRYFRSKAKRGQIVAISSVAGTNGLGRLAAYSASKKFDQTYLVALEQLANSMNAGITFTDIRPGWVRTPLVMPDKQYPFEMTVEYAVPLIIRAIVRKKRVAYIDWRWALVAAAWKLIPDAIWTRVSTSVVTPDKQLPLDIRPDLNRSL